MPLPWVASEPIPLPWVASEPMPLPWVASEPIPLPWVASEPMPLPWVASEPIPLPWVASEPMPLPWVASEPIPLPWVASEPMPLPWVASEPIPLPWVASEPIPLPCVAKPLIPLPWVADPFTPLPCVASEVRPPACDLDTLKGRPGTENRRNNIGTDVAGEQYPLYQRLRALHCNYLPNSRRGELARRQLLRVVNSRIADLDLSERCIRVSNKPLQVDRISARSEKSGGFDLSIRDRTVGLKRTVYVYRLARRQL